MSRLYFSIFPTETGIATNITDGTKLVWFDDAMRPVEQVTELLRESGKSPEYILQWLGFRLRTEAIND